MELPDGWIADNGLKSVATIPDVPPELRDAPFLTIGGKLLRLDIFVQGALAVAFQVQQDTFEAAVFYALDDFNAHGGDVSDIIDGSFDFGAPVEVADPAAAETQAE